MEKLQEIYINLQILIAVHYVNHKELLLHGDSLGSQGHNLGKVNQFLEQISE